MLICYKVISRVVLQDRISDRPIKFNYYLVFKIKNKTEKTTEINVYI